MNLAYQNGFRRLYVRLPGSDFLALRCYGGGGGGSADTTSKNTQATTSGGSSPQTTGDSSPINAGSGTQISTNKGNVSETENLTSNTNYTESTDPEAWTAIENIVGNAANNVSATQQAVVSSQTSSNDALNSILGQVLEADQKTTANTASGGSTETNSNVVYIAMAAIAGVIGLGWLLTRKK
jgi:hypothetical protein